MKWMLLLPLFLLACGDGVSIPFATDQSTKECRDRHDIYSAPYVPPTGGGLRGSGILEQRVLENEVVVRAELLDVDLKVVEIDSISFELKGDHYAYEEYKYTLLNEVELRIYEYLKGEGPHSITAVVEGQAVFNSKGEMDCAKRLFADDFSPLFDSNEGIAFLEPTSDHNLYHMGLAYNNFHDGTRTNYGHYMTWLPAKDGKFYNESTNEWISPADARQRAAGVLEEYNRRDDEEWQRCVFHKYYENGRDPWAYRGVPIPFEYFRDHNIIFNGEDVPVPVGTKVWIWPDRDGDGSGISGRLEGEHADLFELTYYTEYEYTVNEWQGNYGGAGQHLAIWHKAKEWEGESEQWPTTTAGHVVTVAEDLEDGVYKFTPRFEGGRGVDCGQPKLQPSQFTVIVDKDGPPAPPVPTNVRVKRWDDVGEWVIEWDRTRGVDHYRVEVYRLDGDEKEIDGALGSPESSWHRIRFADMKGCGDVIYIEIRAKGDGGIYRDDFSEPSEPFKIEAEPCV